MDGSISLHAPPEALYKEQDEKKDALISPPACGVMKTSLIKTLPLTERTLSAYLLSASEHAVTSECVCVLHYSACAGCLNQLLLAC